MKISTTKFLGRSLTPPCRDSGVTTRQYMHVTLRWLVSLASTCFWRQDKQKVWPHVNLRGSLYTSEQMPHSNSDPPPLLVPSFRWSVLLASYRWSASLESYRCSVPLTSTLELLLLSSSLIFTENFKHRYLNQCQWLCSNPMDWFYFIILLSLYYFSVTIDLVSISKKTWTMF